MKRTLWLASCAVGMAAALLGQGRGAHMGGGRGGGFSREGPAAGGGFSAARERQGAQASREAPSSMQASRQQFASGAQANREQTATGMQASREQTVTGMQSSAQVYHGSYTHTVTAYPGLGRRTCCRRWRHRSGDRRGRRVFRFAFRAGVCGQPGLHGAHRSSCRLDDVFQVRLLLVHPRLRAERTRLCPGGAAAGILT